MITLCTTDLRHPGELGGRTDVCEIYFTYPAWETTRANWTFEDPGCAVDIPAVFYSLSFAPNPFFTKVFPSRAEILEYFNSVAKSFDVHRHVVPNTEWEGAYWQDSTSTWIVKLKDLCTGDTYYKECKILISAVGGLVDPNQLNVPGIDDFKGEIIHTAQWRSDISLRGKDVIVLGNGCEIDAHCHWINANPINRLSSAAYSSNCRWGQEHFAIHQSAYWPNSIPNSLTKHFKCWHLEISDLARHLNTICKMRIFRSTKNGSSCLLTSPPSYYSLELLFSFSLKVLPSDSTWRGMASRRESCLRKVVGLTFGILHLVRCPSSASISSYFLASTSREILATPHATVWNWMQGMFPIPVAITWTARSIDVRETRGEYSTTPDISAISREAA